MRQTKQNRSGTILITAMWVVLVLAGLALVLARSMREEATASANHCSAIEAQAVAQGAAEFVMAQVALADGEALDVLEAPCQGRAVGRGYFWILHANLDEDLSYSYGITDEASKININYVDADMLLNLPRMTSELADCIEDWRDTDSDVSPSGAEDEYYLLLPEPYYCKNDRFETVEELFMVNGATEEIIYGEDRNLNGVLDENEDDNADGRLDPGLYDYATVYSKEPNVTETGEDRINVNERGSQELSQLLRQVVPEDRYFQVMDRVRSRRPFRNPMDFYFKTGLRASEFEQLADRITTSDEEQLEGRININTAPREVLECLPGLDESDVETLLSNRGDDDTESGSIAWVAESLEPEKAVEIGDYITTRSYQFSADIVSVSHDGRAFKRFRLVVDAISGIPRIVYWKDLTHMGWPLDQQILSCLRSGTSLEEAGLITIEETQS